MFFADYHTHSNFSSDSQTPMEQNIQHAIKLGLKEIAVTDHIDFDYPDLDYPFMFDYADYRKQVDYLKEKYSNQIKIIIGVEIGLQPHVYPLILNLVKSNYYDFIIGSTHCVNKLDLCNDIFFDGKTKHDAYVNYFNDVLGNIKNCPVFNVYGHIDFINRYGNYTDKTMNYEEFAFITDEILKALIEKGKGIEINTSGFRYGLGHTHPQLPLVKRYKQLGGEIITVGSDAHVSSDITRDFETAYKMLKSAGFNFITTFQNQKPSFVKINI
jgi:histidinol phosphate phosphatase HisJ family